MENYNQPNSQFNNQNYGQTQTKPPIPPKKLQTPPKRPPVPPKKPPKPPTLPKMLPKPPTPPKRPTTAPDKLITLPNKPFKKSKSAIKEFDEEPRKSFLKNWKFWIILLSIFVAVAIALTVFYFVSINAKINTPSGLKVYALSNDKVYVQVDKDDRAIKYEFLISYNKGTYQRFETESNILESNYINSAGEYIIVCRIIGATERANSEYCESITYLKKVNIATPTISLNSGEKLLNFSLLDNFIEIVELKFYLYFADENGLLFNDKDYVLTENNSRGIASGYFELSFLPAGEYQLSVIVEAVESEFYLPSNLPTQLFYISVD